MATTTKEKNGKVASETVVEMANQVSEEAKVMADTFIDVANKATSETKLLLDAHQKMVKENLAMWQNFNKSYLELMFHASQQGWDESLALQERLSKVSEANWKKAQEVWQAEQKRAVKAAESFQAQAQATSEQMFKLFTATWVK